MESQFSKPRRTMAGALAAGMLLAGVALAGAPAVTAAERQTTLTLNGPSSANSGENVSFKVSGTLNVGTVALLNGDQQVGQVATVGLGTQDVSFNFHTANSNMSLQAINYDANNDPVAYSNKVTLTSTTPKPAAPVVLTLTGPKSAKAGSNVTYTIKGNLSAGTLKLHGDGNQLGQTASIGLGTTTATVSFPAPNSAVALQATNYDKSGSTVGSTNTFTLSPSAPPTPAALVPQAQTLPAAVPNSTRLNKGRTIRLQPSPGITNAGNVVNWKVTSGKKHCKLRRPSSGAVKLKAVRKGTCKVRGTAAAVGNQYQAFKVLRTYRVR